MALLKSAPQHYLFTSISFCSRLLFLLHSNKWKRNYCLMVHVITIEIFIKSNYYFFSVSLIVNWNEFMALVDQIENRSTSPASTICVLEFLSRNLYF